jgi:carbamoylphosphate synthase large subunit
LPQNIALRLKENGVKVLGTDPEKIDMAEDRHKFSSVLDKIGVDQPDWTEVTSVEAAKAFAERVGYAPVCSHLSRSSQRYTPDTQFSFAHLMSSLAPL